MTDTKNKESKTLQIEIVKRFMSDKEWAEFQKEYWSNRYTPQGRNRSKNLSIDVTTQEKEVLKVYLEETDASTAELRERFPGLNPAYTAGRAALKLMYQNPEILRRV